MDNTTVKIITDEEWERKLNNVEIRKEDMNKVVMDCLVTLGHADAAEKFRLESGTEHIDISTLITVTEILKRGNVKDAIEKVNDINPEILDTNPQLFFRLQQQRMIELIRDGKVDEALDFAKEELSPMVEENQSFLEDLEKTAALLAFENASTSPVGELLDLSQRSKLAREVNAAILASQGHEKDPKLFRMMNMMESVQRELDNNVDYPSLHIIVQEPKPEENPAI